ncbi:MAG: hypothetical protein IT365_24995 [Candidatus Hydrogenedentes bacterium]|nr:hypothetical protein [Candidatus Hydrogenedentota bacterium]
MSRHTRLIVLLLVLLPTLTRCASTPAKKKEEPPPPPPPPIANMSIDELRQEVLEYLEGRMAAPGEEKSADTAQKKDAWRQRAHELVALFRKRIHEDLMARIEQDFGVNAPLQSETVSLEALDERGRVVEVPVSVETRELRSLTLPANRAKMHALMGEEDLTLALYSGAPATIAPQESKGFMRAYTGEEAEALAMEAKLVITLKGGEWVESGGAGTVANAIAIRGLDMDQGLHDNTNKRYDDTMFVIVEDSGGTYSAYEYRMTTESSSERRGVGRLDSKQVIYVRGLHRGVDPAYKLKGGAAEGTRVQMEGDFKIVGANVHSAYSKRPITSDTPLKENVSLGCQVVAASKPDFEKSMVYTLDKLGVKEFPYTIVDEEELAFLDQSLQEKGKRSLLVHAVSRGAT